MSSTNESILVRLQDALNADGDFPTRAKVITEIRRLTEDPLTPLDKVVETILSEPSLATRILHIVNSVYYARSKPIETLSQAVVHVGLKSIYNLCANFVVLQRFTPLVKKGGAFYNSFVLSMITSYMASYLDGVENKKDKEEEGYLSGSLFTLGPLLLGYYFPKLFTDAEKRSERKRITLYKSIEELLGVPAVGISLGVVDTLSIPEFYKEILSQAFVLYSDQGMRNDFKGRSSARSVCAATLIGELVLENPDLVSLRHGITAIGKDFDYESHMIEDGLKNLPVVAEQQSSLLGIHSIELPSSLLKFIKGEVETPPAVLDDSEDNPLTPYLEQLEQGIQESETLASIIATVMEALAFAMDFERVIYLEADIDEKNLLGKLGLGDKLDSYDTINEAVSEDPFSEHAHLKSYSNRSIETCGSPLIENGWPFVALPVGYEDRILGVIYADQVDTNKGPLETRETVAISLLADILDRAIQKNRV
jgi:hypothetical protein